MGDSRVFFANSADSRAGTINRIRLENFMCHSHLEIELCPSVNFITGQNGSGKSAILTALCVAFGRRPRGTTALRDLIKIGCSYAVVEVEVQNQGRHAFKQEIYGDTIIIQCRIDQSISSTILMGFQGRKIASQREELQELIKHFDIDVENPIVITSQGKSSEFSHPWNDKENFKFFFKGTLKVYVELFQEIAQLRYANELVDELEATTESREKELNQLQVKIKTLEHIKGIAQLGQQSKRKLSLSSFNSVEPELKDCISTFQSGDLEKKRKLEIEDLGEEINCMNKIMRTVGLLQQQIRDMTEWHVNTQKFELAEDREQGISCIQEMMKTVGLLQQQVQDMQEQHALNTQENCSKLEKLNVFLNRVNHRLQYDRQWGRESIDELRMLYRKKQHRILRKKEIYKGFREMLKAREEALPSPRDEFLRDSSILTRQFNWNFNCLLRIKGISGRIQVNYEAETLRVVVNVPQGALNRTIRDTRELSDGERSFVALCFALAAQDTTLSPFRAMDGFDVFMDAESRKISTETIVDFAINQGSQWIIITPHDISMVREGERIKKHQMAAHCS